MSGPSSRPTMLGIGALAVGVLVGFAGSQLIRHDEPDAPRDSNADRQTAEWLRAISASLADLQRSVDQRFERAPAPSGAAPTLMTDPARADVEAKLTDTSARLASVETKLDALSTSLANLHADTLRAMHESGAEPMPDELPEARSIRTGSSRSKDWTWISSRRSTCSGLTSRC